MNLIYYTAFGAVYNKLCNISINTLLINGQYKDEIIIFTDNPYFYCDFTDNEKIKIVLTESPGIFSIACSRIYLAEQIYFIKYENIMYCDCDVIFNHKINSIFYFNHFIKVCREKTIHSFYPANNYCFNNFFSPDEYFFLKNTPIINAGIFIIKGKIFKTLLNQYKEIVEPLKSFSGVDQSALNKLVYGAENNFKASFFDVTEVNITQEYNTKPIMTHYLREDGKKVIYKYYENQYFIK